MLTVEKRLSHTDWLKRLKEAGAVPDCADAEYELAEMECFNQYAKEIKASMILEGCVVETICFDADENTNDHIAIVSYLPII